MEVLLYCSDRLISLESRSCARVTAATSDQYETIYNNNPLAILESSVDSDSYDSRVEGARSAAFTLA
jgi:hypothetical protein